MFKFITFLKDRIVYSSRTNCSKIKLTLFYDKLNCPKEILPVSFETHYSYIIICLKSIIYLILIYYLTFVCKLLEYFL